ncbi:unnamed protein product [Notodromas monacha]|uniref:Uncharacterized protein n=1 Tax=Notodromas monacha TaxID=399045 RepID=A0A7R9GHS7_9CRUS|nr:unnamed protein product [Notodromas monacha]CAG0921826.1 unnamed protein product [Notodromas monacha]
MALLNKFFAKCRSSERSAKVTEVPLKLSPEFTRDQLRVVIMRDSSTRGFRLLFDSASVEQVPLPARPSCQKQTPGACSLSWTHSRSASRPEKQCNEFAEKTDGYGYRYLALKSDVAKLMEMAFGSGAMRCQGCTSKIHYLTSSKVQKRGIFISLVFPAPPRRRRDWQHSSHSDASLDSSLSSAGDFGNETASNTSDPAFPSQSSQILSHADPWCHLQSDSTAARNRESRASMGPPSHASSASLESESNSVEGGNDANKTRCYRWMHRKSTAESLDAADYERGRRMCRSGTKLALGLVVDLGSDFPSRERLEWFLLVHMRSIDTLLWKLKAVLENVYACAPFVHTIFLAVEDILQSVVDLYVVPRLLRPLWTVISVGNEEVWHSVAAEFIPELVAVVDLYDSKDTHL